MKLNISPENIIESDSKENEVRLEKLKELEKLGINPWPDNQEINSSIDKIKNNFEKEAGQEYKIFN